MFPTPDDIFGELFVDVQLTRIFKDSKTFADCLPRKRADEILRAYSIAKSKPTFSLYGFVMKYFTVPGERETDFTTEQNIDIRDHIARLWPVLSRSGNKLSDERKSSLIPLPFPYIVPGGRFREIYYWDSYFTQLGLAADGQWAMIESMVKNFAYLIDMIGHVPNGNRTYFVSRSQPPFFAAMVELLASHFGDQVYQEFLVALEKEYAFWMDGQQSTDPKQPDYRRLVRLASGKFLNRYYDDHPKPRQESFTEDVHLAGQSSRNAEDIYLNLRAACESGWDFSSRWCEIAGDLTTIRTTHFIPVDLNCCLLKLEAVLQRAYELSGRTNEAIRMKAAYSTRIGLLTEYCWDAEQGYFFDYDFVKGKRSESIHAAGLFPLFLEVVTRQVADKVVNFVKKRLWAPGGIATTSVRTGQQWDAPNGWAPLQWLAYRALTNYGFNNDADSLANRWMGLNNRVFLETGRLMEKYNVLDVNALAGGGEYPVQDGFGWTNGVYLAMLKDQDDPEP